MVRINHEAFFAKKIILVEGQSESLCLPYFFDLLEYDYINRGITIVRCGSKNDIDRFYRLYSEFSIPCFIIFDGDSSHIGTVDERETTKINKAILSCLNIDSSFPDGRVYSNYLGFVNSLNENLGFSTTRKGLTLFKQVKANILRSEQVPEWVSLVIDSLERMPEQCRSILRLA